jgi:hypothetical protein
MNHSNHKPNPKKRALLAALGILIVLLFFFSFGLTVVGFVFPVVFG